MRWLPSNIAIHLVRSTNRVLGRRHNARGKFGCLRVEESFPAGVGRRALGAMSPTYRKASPLSPPAIRSHGRACELQRHND